MVRVQQVSTAAFVCTVQNCAVAAAKCKGFLLQQALSYKTLQLAVSHSACLWLLCGTKRGGRKLSCRTERQKRVKVLWEREREREWVMRGGCWTEDQAEREGDREASESGSEREWQWMYLSRSQIINRDSVVWIERKRGESGGEKASGSKGERGEREMGGVGRWGGASENRRWDREKVEECGVTDGQMEEG